MTVGVKSKLFCIILIAFHNAAYGLTELELQKLDKYPFAPILPTQTLDRVFLDLHVIRTPHTENMTPVSMKEYRSQLKQLLALQIHPKWQIGLDSFKSCPIDKQLIEWPGSTQPLSNRSPSKRGYGVNVRMKLD